MIVTLRIWITGEIGGNYKDVKLYEHKGQMISSVNVTNVNQEVTICVRAKEEAS